LDSAGRGTVAGCDFKNVPEERMQHPDHEILSRAQPAISRQRAIGLGLVALLHVLFVWALIEGLATRIVTAIPQELKAQVIAPAKDETQPPQPPQPTMVVPKDSIAPPEIEVQSTPTAAIQQPMAPAPSAPSTRANGIASTHTTPPYPGDAKEKGHQGIVILHIMISASGDVTSATVTTSSGFPELDQQAVSWVSSHWKYKPALENGVAVASASDAKVVFDLKNANG
jgi:protein TonB